MGKKLVIVESPSKAKTIGRLLGKNYKVMASVGHVRDLPKSSLGIEIDNNFEPKYITIRGKGPILQELRNESKKADKVYLATDPDREGEAISWHLAHALNLNEDEKIRVEFNEITKDSVKKAIKNPRVINENLVDAQQARRVLDRLVGYKISPILWKKIRKGLSAGRVQSVAVKLIVDRENEINEFKPEEYWSIKALFSKKTSDFEGEFYGYIDKSGKEEKLKINNKDEVDIILDKLTKGKYEVYQVKKGSRRRNPYPPYITSTLQQDASNRLNFNTRKTMMVAQQLYEGINGQEGLITYMRTDSTRISDIAISQSKDYIISNYGSKYLKSRKYGNNKKSSQDAHEAIRPTSIDKTPDSVRSKLNDDQFKLYQLIWNRFLASQMSSAVYDTISVSIKNGDYIFRSSGSKLIFDGFLRVYGDKDKEMEIPDLTEGDLLKPKSINEEQHFTKPPARYTEASLIKSLEELGIGRPSTFAPTISTIISREYVNLDKKSFIPTELGILVNEVLSLYFGEIINEEFTANLEANLDEIEDGEKKWKSVVSDFYQDFHKYLEKAEKEMEEIIIEDEETDIPCDMCGRNMVIKNGRFGKFLACPGYPECKNTKAILDKIGVKCPKCGNDLVRRRSRRGRVFYGCSDYPNCKFSTWQEPTNKKCEKCHSMMTKTENSKSITYTCINEECKHKEKELKKK